MGALNVPRKKKEKRVQAVFYNRHEHQLEKDYFLNRADAIMYGLMHDLKLVTLTEDFKK
jgi:hypothetical protein